MDGFIQIHRKILEWEWYDDINTKVLFIHLLLIANYKENKWRGRLIKPGQLVTGRNKLSEQTGLSVMQVRTSLDKLKSTGEITIEITSEYSILTLNNWATYNQQSNQQVTSEQPASNQQVTTTNKDNKYNKDNNIISKDIIDKSTEKKDNRDKNIDMLLQVIKESVELEGFIYKKGKYERERAKNILTGKDFGEVCNKSNMTPIEFCQNIIFISSKLDFWRGKIYNAETLYTHYHKVYNDALSKKQEIEKSKPRSIII